MIFGPRRGSILFIFDKFISTFGLLIVVLAFSLFTNSWDQLQERVIPLAIGVFMPFFRLVRYFSTKYSVSQETFYIRQSFISKKDMEIPLSAITNVDLSQSLLFRLFQTQIITVDTAAGIRDLSVGKIQLALATSQAEEFKTLLLSKKATPTVPEGQTAHHAHPTPSNQEEALAISQFSASPLEIITMGLLEKKLLIIFQMLTLVGGIITFTSPFLFNEGIDGDEYIMSKLVHVSGYSLIFLILSFFYLLGLLGGVITALIHYYGFKVVNMPGSIVIEYGLFTRKVHALDKVKISGVEYQQSFFMKLFRTGRLNVYAVGYGDNTESRSPLLFPLLPSHKVHGFLDSLLPDLLDESTPQRPPAHALPYFFISPKIIFGTTFFLASIALGLLPLEITPPLSLILDAFWIFGLLIFAMAITSVILEYRQTSLSATSKSLVLVHGGYTRKTAYIRTSKVENISNRGSVWKRKKSIISIQIGIWGPPMDAHHNLRNMSSQTFQQLKSILNY